MTSTGTSRMSRRRAAASLLAGAALLCHAAAPAADGRSQRQKRSQETYAIVAGTVFREDGRVLAGASVSLKPDPETGASPKGKPLTAPSDGRGEFAFRVPAGPMRYTVTVKAPGYKTQDKAASIVADERADVFFQMERARPEE
jgi:hypothetical protein